MGVGEHLAIAAAGAVVGGLAIRAGISRPRSNLVALVAFVGLGVAVGAAVNALDAADVSDRVRGLWFYGVGTVLFLAAAVAARRPDARGIRLAALAAGGLLLISCVVLAVWDVDISDPFFAWL